jgi:hypothetical protein
MVRRRLRRAASPRRRGGRQEGPGGPGPANPLRPPAAMGVHLKPRTLQKPADASKRRAPGKPTGASLVAHAACAPTNTRARARTHTHTARRPCVPNRFPLRKPSTRRTSCKPPTPQRDALRPCASNRPNRSGHLAWRPLRHRPPSPQVTYAVTATPPSPPS